MGHVLNYTMGDVQTHLRRRQGWRCCGRWASTRSACLPRTRPSAKAATARDHRALHRRHPRADEAARLGDRLGPRGLGPRGGLLPLDAVALPTVLRARPRLPQGCAGQLVPERPDGRRERARHRRPVLALPRWRRETSSSGSFTAYADELLEYDLPEGAGGGLSERRRSSATGSAVRRRRSCSGSTSSIGRARLHDSPRHAVRRDVLRAGARASARRAHRLEEVQAYAKQTAARRGEEGHRGVKTGVFTGFYATNPVNGDGCPSTSPTTC